MQRYTHRGCPHCDDPNVHYPQPVAPCILNSPLAMVIPPGGVHLSCPAHPEGHHVFGPVQVRC